jgi:hypothetical protein
LKENLGMEDEADGIIVNLRTMESVLQIHRVRHNTCRTRYREVFQEADSEDICKNNVMRGD